MATAVLIRPTEILRCKLRFARSVMADVREFTARAWRDAKLNHRENFVCHRPDGTIVTVYWVRVPDAEDGPDNLWCWSVRFPDAKYPITQCGFAEANDAAQDVLQRIWFMEHNGDGLSIEKKGDTWTVSYVAKRWTDIADTLLSDTEGG